MRTIRLTNGGASALIETESFQPGPGRDDLLIRVSAAGVTPTELGWYPTTHLLSGKPRVAAVPCHEFSGVVESVGDEVGHLEIGQEVYGMNDWFAEGALADFCVAPFSAVAPKPASLSHVEAASVPIGALTAWQGLFDHAHLRRGERVLIHGAAGGVGIYAVQLAHRHGAHVTATASAHNLEFVSGLGADQVIDYRARRFEDVVRSVDVVFDTVGGDTLARSWEILHPLGRLVTIFSGGGADADHRVKQAFFIVEPNQKQLSQVAGLIDGGELIAVVDTVVPWSRAADAFTGAIARTGRGKVVIAVDAASQPQSVRTARG